MKNTSFLKLYLRIVNVQPIGNRKAQIAIETEKICKKDDLYHRLHIRDMR